MRLRPELRRDLSEGNPPDHVDRRSRWPGHEAGARRPAAKVTRFASFLGRDGACPVSPRLASVPGDAASRASTGEQTPLQSLGATPQFGSLQIDAFRTG